MNTQTLARATARIVTAVSVLALSAALTALSAQTAPARQAAVTQQSASLRQTDADAYTRYELLAPGSGKFPA